MITFAKALPSRLAAVKTRVWIMGVMAFCALYSATAAHLDERLFFAVKTNWVENGSETRALWLPEYQVRVDALPVETVKDNLSGLTFDEDRDHLWAVINNPEELVALDKNGTFMARYPLAGFSDVEGVTYLGDNLLVLAEERQQALVVLPVPEQPGELQREDFASISLKLGEADNAGFEGVGYDRQGDRLFVVKEHSPRKLYEIRGVKGSLNGQMSLDIMDRSAWIEGIDMVVDLSSVHFDERTGHLVLLSDEAKMLVELDGEGQLVSFRSLWSGVAGLKSSVPQAEGVTLDARGNLYLVSEPNLFYALQSK